MGLASKEINIMDYKVKLKLNTKLSLIIGNSGVGKSLIYNYFRRQSRANSSDVFCINVDDIDRYRDGVLDELKHHSNKLIVIDNADIILSKDMHKYIVREQSNAYLLFGRSVNGLWATDDNIAMLVRNNEQKLFYLDYCLKAKD